MAEAANVMEVELVDFQGQGADDDGRPPSTAAASTVLRRRFFCHRCVVEIDPKMPGFTCPQCNSGFIEEISDNFHRDRETTTATSLIDLLTSSPSRSHYDAEDDSSGSVETLPRPRGSSISYLSMSRRPSHRAEHALPLHSFIESVLDSLRDDNYRQFGTDFSEPRLRRYGRDFRRSYSGLEDLFTQILTQLTASGPEPASLDQISELPVEKIKHRHLENSMQCSICLENFVLDEEVISLPCNHLHHKFCIVTWLQLHATCPVCRHLLPTASQEPASAGSQFHSTERSDLSLQPVDSERFQTHIEDSIPVNLSVHSPRAMGPPPRLMVPSPLIDDPEVDSFIDVTAIRHSDSTAITLAPDIEMVNMDSNDVAVETESGGRHETYLRDRGSFSASFQLSGLPGSNLVCLRDIEVTGIESESDL